MEALSSFLVWCETKSLGTYKQTEKWDEKLQIEAITCIYFEYLEITLTNEN